MEIDDNMNSRTNHRYKIHRSEMTAVLHENYCNRYGNYCAY